MNTDEISMLIGYGEDGRIDRKRSLRLDTPWHKVEFAKDVMAFANGHDARPAYILIGVDEGGNLHDVGELPDEATLQQIVSSYLDPPVSFLLSRHNVHGVRLAVLEIPPSEERFHSAARDVQGDGGKYLLRQGEILIRRGTAKMPPKALDFKLLKQEYAERQSPQAKLDVRFAGDTHELTTVRGWPMPSKVLLQIMSHVFIPPNTGRFDCCYQFIPLRFFIHNRGQHQAEAVVIDINFPDDCQAVAASPNERDRKAWETKVSRSANRVRIEGERVIHGDHQHSQDVYVRFFRRGCLYTLEWTARAGNVLAPVRGSLQVEVLENGP